MEYCAVDCQTPPCPECNGMSVSKSFTTEPTPEEREALYHLAEEAAEIVKDSMKVLRFGYESMHEGTSNRDRLSMEVGNFLGVLKLFSNHLNPDMVGFGITQKMEKLKTYSRYHKG